MILWLGQVPNAVLRLSFGPGEGVCLKYVWKRLHCAIFRMRLVYFFRNQSFYFRFILRKHFISTVILSLPQASVHPPLIIVIISIVINILWSNILPLLIHRCTSSTFFLLVLSLHPAFPSLNQHLAFSKKTLVDCAQWILAIALLFDEMLCVENILGCFLG